MLHCLVLFLSVITCNSADCLVAVSVVYKWSRVENVFTVYHFLLYHIVNLFIKRTVSESLFSSDK